MARHRYRGRSPLRRFLTALGIAALVLAVLAGTASLFLRPYLVRTESGWRLNMPFLNNLLYSPTPEPTPSAEPTPVVEVVSTSSPTPTPTPTPEPTPAPGQRRAIFLPTSALLTENAVTSYLDMLSGSQLNALVIDMKNDNGDVFTKDAQVAAAVTALKEGGAYLIARLSVVLDNSITRQLATYGIKHTSGVNWLGQGSSRYLNIYRPEVRGYLVDIVTAVRDMGFDEILLANLHFPVEGLLDAISYGEYAAISREEGLKSLISELIAVGIPLSAVLLPETLTTGVSVNGGQNLAYFQDVFMDLYVSGTDFAPEDPYVAQVPLPPAGAGGTQQELLSIALGHARNYVIVSENGVYPPDLFK